MFIDNKWNEDRPPSGGPCQCSWSSLDRPTDMALLTEGARIS
jgi:hypothetical protein